MAGFLNRWAKRKAGVEVNEPAISKLQPAPQSTTSSNSPEISSEKKINGEDISPQDTSTKELMPTLDDVLKLTKDSDYSAYVKPGIDPSVQQAAMQKLFSDPHYNIMDGLDIYIDDYSKPDPIPLEMLKKLNQSQLLGLFKTQDEKNADAESERIEHEQYQSRLQALEAAESADSEQQVKNALPDETPSDIKKIDSAKSLELNNTQEITNTNQAKPVDKAG